MEFSAVECRVVGCLIEKERATPQNYPLTLNSLRLACNQATNREPVVDYDDDTVERALASLRERGITRIVYSTHNRAAKYRHVLGEHLRLGDDELAVIAVLLLRGPQTVGEIKGRTDRLHAFGDLNAVQATLDRLAAREDDPLVRRLERRPGQKDARWVHLLAGAVDDADEPEIPARGSFAMAAPAPPPQAHRPEVSAPVVADRRAVADRPALSAGADGDGATGIALAAVVAEVSRLEAELAAARTDLDVLRSHLAALRAEFETFRSEFT